MLLKLLLLLFERDSGNSGAVGLTGVVGVLALHRLLFELSIFILLFFNFLIKEGLQPASVRILYSLTLLTDFDFFLFLSRAPIFGLSSLLKFVSFEKVTLWLSFLELESNVKLSQLLEALEEIHLVLSGYPEFLGRGSVVS